MHGEQPPYRSLPFQNVQGRREDAPHIKVVEIWLAAQLANSLLPGAVRIVVTTIQDAVLEARGQVNPTERRGREPLPGSFTG